MTYALNTKSFLSPGGCDARMDAEPPQRCGRSAMEPGPPCREAGASSPPQYATTARADGKPTSDLVVGFCGCMYRSESLALEVKWPRRPLHSENPRLAPPPLLGVVSPAPPWPPGGGAARRGGAAPPASGSGRVGLRVPTKQGPCRLAVASGKMAASGEAAEGAPAASGPGGCRGDRRGGMAAAGGGPGAGLRGRSLPELREMLSRQERLLANR